MYQESVSRDRPDAELSGYGDLSNFNPKKTRRSKEQSEEELINLVMKGEGFLVGDGTLDFNLREEDQDLLDPPVDVVTTPELVREVPSRQVLKEFPPIEDGYPDPGDEVARIAINESLARLEAMAGEAPHSSVVDEVEQETSGELLSEDRTDELLGGGFGGMGSDFDSDAPSPFALPKMPGTFEQQYVAPAHEAIAAAKAEELCEPVARRFEGEVLQRRTEVSDVTGTVDAGHIPQSEVKAEEFAPFELPASETIDHGSFDSRAAEVPSYARATNKRAAMSAAASDLDEFLPPSNDEPRGVIEAIKSSPLPSYSQPRTTVHVEEDQAAHPFGERYPQEAEAPVSKAQEPPAEPETQSIQEEDHVAAPAAPTKPSLFAQYKNILLAAALGIVLVGGKYYAKQQSSDAPAATSAMPAALSEVPARDIPRPPISAVIGNSMPVAMPSQIEQPLPLAGREMPLSAPIESAVAQKAEKPAAIDAAAQAKIDELATQMAALESERNRLREENEALKKKPAPAKPKAAALKKKSVAVETVAPAPESIRKPLHNIQYLGTFHEGDRLVAEVLIDGNLARIKRGDQLAGNRRVDAVGDMSVTIDEVVYSP
jgi:Tfp pilus assembly protein PilP